MRKAQAAFEYMVITIFVLGFLTPIWLYVSNVQTRTSDEFALSYAKNTVSQLAKYADMVYSQRSDARVKIGVYIPENVQFTNVTDHMINIRVLTTSGPVDVFEFTEANLTGSIPVESGFYWMIIKAEGDVVNITKM